MSMMEFKAEGGVTVLRLTGEPGLDCPGECYSYAKRKNKKNIRRPR